MKRLLLGLLFFAPAVTMAQDVKNGTITFDFNKKKKQADSSSWQEPVEETVDTAVVKKPRARKQTEALPKLKPLGSDRPYDYKRDGVFSGLFMPGLMQRKLTAITNMVINISGLKGALVHWHVFTKYFQ